MSNNQKFYIYHGLPGSGKSTLAKNLAMEHPETVIINRDTIRENLFGAEYHKGSFPKESEKQVTEVQEKLVDEAMKNGKSVISDDTNLDPHIVAQWFQRAKKYGATVEQIHVDVPLETVKERNRIRGQQGVRLVPEHVIDGMAEKAYDEFGHIKEYVATQAGDRVMSLPKTSSHSLKIDEYNKELSKKFPLQSNAVVILDADGTLFNNHADSVKYLNNGGKKDFPGFFRSIKDAEANPNVVDLVWDMREKDNVNIFLVTGRSDSSAGYLMNALLKSNAPVSKIIMKREGDSRKSNEFKLDVINSLKEDGLIPVHAIDDREQDINMFENNGIIVSKVGLPIGNDFPKVDTIYNSGSCIRCGQKLKKGNIGPVCKTKMHMTD